MDMVFFTSNSGLIQFSCLVTHGKVEIQIAQMQWRDVTCGIAHPGE